MATLHPIIYVRGFAMTETERDETAADPFCGFNVGSTVYRATPDKQANADKFVFESPVVRLVTEYGYRQVYQNGADIMDADWAPPTDANGQPTQGIPPQSIIIYRYYDDGSQLLGDGVAKSVETYAKGLSQLILKVRSLVCEHAQATGAPLSPDGFKCYLVAHSMGGLVVRAFLQNRTLGDDEARKAVAKFFTYATPHNGIDAAGINVPHWITAAEANTFNRERMADFLDMKAIAAKYDGRVDFMPESVLKSDKIFCMVGTNRADYEVLKGVVRAFVGHGSDGLVRVANASLWGLDDKLNVTKPVATAHAYRSHSGFFGIVNSEEAYQNLIRFLFGDVRVDIWLDIDAVQLPAPLQTVQDPIEALYLFEFLAAPRGKRWYLSRRVAEEDSTACRTHKQLTQPQRIEDKSIYLSTVFLANKARVNPNLQSLAYSMTLAVKVPDYQVAKRFWPDQHYEGNDLFRDTAIIELTPPQQPGQQWTVKHGWASQTDGTATTVLTYQQLQRGGHLQIDIPFAANRKPGISGKIRLMVNAWD